MWSTLVAIIYNQIFKTKERSCALGHNCDLILTCWCLRRVHVIICSALLIQTIAKINSDNCWSTDFSVPIFTLMLPFHARGSDFGELHCGQHQPITRPETKWCHHRYTFCHFMYGCVWYSPVGSISSKILWKYAIYALNHDRGRRKEGPWLPWILKILAKKVVFSISSG